MVVLLRLRGGLFGDVILMSKYYRNRPLEVFCQGGDIPLAIRDVQGAWKVERALEYWRDTGRWWDGESEKAFFRLRLETGGVREIYQDLGSGAWYLYKSYD